MKRNLLFRFLARLRVGRKLLLIYLLDLSAVLYISGILIYLTVQSSAAKAGPRGRGPAAALQSITASRVRVAAAASCIRGPSSVATRSYTELATHFPR